MIYGSNEKGEAIFTLSPDEHVQFKGGLSIGKVVGSASGTYRITISMTQIRGPEGSDPDHASRVEQAYMAAVSHSSRRLVARLNGRGA